MKLIYRRIFFWCSVVIFFTLGPALIMYAQGYRFEFTNRSLVSTGTLVVSSQPVNALISLNGQSLNDKTPLTIESLTPGEYTLALSADGYWPWEKRLTIEQNGSTFASDILLIKNDPVTIKQENVSYLWRNPFDLYSFITIAPEKTTTEIAWYTGSLINSTPTKMALSLPVSKLESAKVVVWSETSEQVVLNLDSQLWLIDFASDVPKSTNISKYFIPQWETVNWSKDNEIVMTNKKTVTKLNTITLQTTQIYSSLDEISTVFAVNDNYFIIEDNGSRSALKSIMDGKSSEIATLTGRRHTLNYVNPEILVVSTIEKEMQVYHATDSGYRLGYSFGNVNETVYNEETNELLFTTGNEFFTYNIKDDALALLTRQAQTITNISWLQDTHAVFQSGQNIVLIERDGRNGHVSYSLTDELQQNYAIPANYKQLFFIKEDSGQLNLATKNL